MAIVENGLGLVAIVGGLLLGLAMLYAWFRNRSTSDRDRARTEQATRDLQQTMEREEKTREQNGR